MGFLISNRIWFIKILGEFSHEYSKNVSKEQMCIRKTRLLSNKKEKVLSF